MIALDEVKAHLKLVGTAEDATLTAFIASTIAHVKNYLEATYTAETVPVPGQVGGAVADRRPLREPRGAIRPAIVREPHLYSTAEPYRMMEV